MLTVFTKVRLVLAALLVVALASATARAESGPRLGIRTFPAADGGLKVVGVLAGYPAEDMQLQAGDLLTQINGQDVNTIADLDSALDGAIANGGTVTVTFVRGDVQDEASGTLAVEKGLRGSKMLKAKNFTVKTIKKVQKRK
jgi:S1-C subfamily serine protease